MKPSFRCSELDRLLSCSGSISLVPRVAPRQGDEGFEGTAIHWHIAKRLIAEHGAVPLDGGLPDPDIPKGYVIPPFSAWIVEWAVRHVVETVPRDWSLMVEQPLAYEFNQFALSGHLDWLAISPCGTESIGGDWKTGRDPVDPADTNDQVAGYLALQKRAWPSLRKLTFQIAQPWNDEDSGFERISSVTVQTTTKKDMPALLVESMEQRINAAIANPYELNSGRKQCRWCPVGCQCPALQQELQAMKLKLTPEAIDRVKQQPDDAALGDWVIVMRTLARPSKDAEDILHERLDANPAIVAGCGTQITRKIQRGAYTVLDPVKFFQAAKTLLPSEQSIANAFTPSMTRLKDEIAAVQNIPKSGKASVTAETVFDAKLRPLVEQGERRILVFA